MAQAIKLCACLFIFAFGQDGQLAGWSTEGFSMRSTAQDAEWVIKSGGSNDMIQAGQALLGICLR